MNVTVTLLLERVATTLVGAATPMSIGVTAVNLATPELPVAYSRTVARGKSNPARNVLHVANLSVRDERGRLAVDGVDLDVRAGEIVAIAGVQGNGQTELVEALTGLRAVEAGSASLDGEPLDLGSPRKIADAGVAHIPEDRNRDGMIKGMTIAENLMMNAYHRAPFSKNGRLDLQAISANASRAIQDFDVRTPSAQVFIGTLSGGNQQKVIVAREFSRDVKLVIAAQPTRGLDVGSIEYIHKKIVERRDAGAAVLIVSTELDEVMALGDRIAVMYQGRLMGILEGAEATRERIGLLMGGVS